MSIVLKHVLPSVRPKLRLALGVGLLSLLFVGGAQFFGLDLTSMAATTASELKTFFRPGGAKLAPVPTHSAAHHLAHSGKRVRADEHLLKLSSTSAAPGSEVIVPIEVNAEGNESQLAFSLSF